MRQPATESLASDQCRVADSGWRNVLWGIGRKGSTEPAGGTFEVVWIAGEVLKVERHFQEGSYLGRGGSGFDGGGPTNVSKYLCYWNIRWDTPGHGGTLLPL